MESLGHLLALNHNQKQERIPFSQIAEPLYELGFWPIPIDEKNKKKPIVRHKDAVAKRRLTIRQLREWIKAFPNADTGTLVPKGKVCADFDVQEKPEGLHLPVTPIAQTRHGEHHWYATEEAFKTRKMVMNGLVWGDVRGEGSFVVLPPSVVKGFQYHWTQYLSPQETDFAQTPTWIQNLRQERREKRSKAPSNEDTVLCLASGTATSLFPKSGDLLKFSQSPSVLPHVLRFLSIPDHAEVDGSAFCCVLPGHDETNPSASLFRMEDGTVRYRDWHLRSGREWFSLPELYVSQLYQRAVWFKAEDGENWASFTHLVWQARLLIDSGVLSVPRPAILPAEDAPESAFAVADGLSLLFACRWLLNYGEPVPFSWRFANLWCGLGNAAIQEGMQYLLKHHLIRIVGNIGIGGRETALFLPGK